MFRTIKSETLFDFCLAQIQLFLAVTEVRVQRVVLYNMSTSIVNLRKAKGASKKGYLGIKLLFPLKIFPN